MASQTLAETTKFLQDDLIAGIAEDIIDINPFYEYLPWMPFTGDAVTVNREDALGDAGFFAVDATITTKTPATYVQRSFTATKIIGDAEIDGLVQAQAEGDGVDMITMEIASKAKSIGRQFQTGIATGTGVSPQMNSLHSLVDSGQFTTASAGQALSFALLDELLDLVLSKNGQVDWIMMPPRTIRSYRALVRAMNGNTADYVVQSPFSGRMVPAYEGIPIFRNDFLSVVETANGAALTGGALTSVWAGNFDDGTRKVGVAAIYPISMPAGISIKEVGQYEAKDTEIWRVRLYANFVLFNRKGLARLPSINN